MTSILKKIMLKTSDNEIFEVEEPVAVQSQTIKNMIEDDCADSVIPVPNVTGKTLSMVLEYCKKHIDDNKEDESAKIKAWDDDLANVLKSDLASLYDILMAANFLNVKKLLDLACQAAADMIKGKTPEQIRKTFNIKNDFTPEEEQQIMSENAWAFEE